MNDFLGNVKQSCYTNTVVIQLPVKGRSVK